VPSYAEHPLAANRHLVHGVHNIAVATPLPLRRWVELEQVVVGGGSGPAPSSRVRLRWLALLRARSVSRAGRLEPTALPLYPSAWVAPRWLGAASSSQALGLIQRDGWRPEAYAILETTAVEPPRRGQVGELLWSEWGRHRVTVRAWCEQQQVLVVGRTAYPGWRAHLDGSWSAAEPVDYLFQGVRLPAGTHRVDLVYRPMALAATVGWAAASGRGGRVRTRAETAG
jgi:hypothetical protein